MKDERKYKNMKLLKQIKNAACAGRTLSIVFTCFIFILTAINVKADTLGEHRTDLNGYGFTVYNTTYGKQEYIIDILIDFIKEDYGEAAANAYIQGVISGDYYQYRSITGFWQPTQLDPTLKAHAMSNKANPIFYMQTPVTSREAFVYDYLGPYGTMADYVAICQQYNVTAFSTEWKSGVDVYAQYVEGTMPKTGTKITKQQYLANHSNATTVTATSSNSAVEALKTYSGNTSEFNAYTYYMRYADLQSAVGANGDALLKHWQAYGKAEGRIAN